MQRAGWRTAKRGLEKVGRALKSPVVLLVLFGVPAGILLAELGLNIGLRHWTGRALSGTWYGFFLGAGVTAAFLVLFAEILVLAGGVNWITGSLFERESAKLFEGLGSDWRLTHNVVVTLGIPPRTWEVDIDHIAIGPYGVLVIETKFSTNLGAIEELTIKHRDVRQARRSADAVQHMLDKESVRAPVRPVLVYWGPIKKVPTKPVSRVGDVRVVYGGDSERWLPLLADRRIDSETEDAAWAAICHYATEQAGA